MEMKWLEDLLALVHNGSFSAAAADRHVTQPALSRRIRALEQWVGVPLVNRAVYPVQLTPYGQEFMGLARQTVASMQAMRADLRQASGENGQRVRVLALHTLASRTVPELIAPLMRNEPSLTVEIVPSVQGVESHFDELDGGGAQLLVGYSQLRPETRTKDYERRIVAHDALVPVASRAFVDEDGRCDLQRSREVPLLRYSPFTFSAALLDRVFTQIGTRLLPRAESPLAETLKALCLQGLGVAWLPRSSVADELVTGVLRIVGAECFHVPVEVCAWRRFDLNHRRAVHLFEALPSLAAAAEPSQQTSHSKTSAPKNRGKTRGMQ
ncbi:LysR family transcriptional regulator [Acidovorax sp. SUPP3434]|uniref:LysR family transcriptional regulator n=1 Tax=Acidovorax sp. SUPP3434 TaxID=2920880 RepID=UPI0023DE3AAB|nr:LysR family transcriptional regulator [Acidovorax sp. SUPP3434]GKT01149.1 LysR family transcriptional regulator [Acidovorax sp. SUPP3434]